MSKLEYYLGIFGSAIVAAPALLFFITIILTFIIQPEEAISDLIKENNPTFFMLTMLIISILSISGLIIIKTNPNKRLNTGIIFCISGIIGIISVLIKFNALSLLIISSSLLLLISSLIYILKKEPPITLVKKVGLISKIGNFYSYLFFLTAILYFSLMLKKFNPLTLVAFLFYLILGFIGNLKIENYLSQKCNIKISETIKIVLGILAFLSYLTVMVYLKVLWQI